MRDGLITLRNSARDVTQSLFQVSLPLRNQWICRLNLPLAVGED